MGKYRTKWAWAHDRWIQSVLKHIRQNMVTPRLRTWHNFPNQWHYLDLKKNKYIYIYILGFVRKPLILKLLILNMKQILYLFMIRWIIMVCLVNIKRLIKIFPNSFTDVKSYFLNYTFFVCVCLKQSSSNGSCKKPWLFVDWVSKQCWKRIRNWCKEISSNLQPNFLRMYYLNNYFNWLLKLWRHIQSLLSPSWLLFPYKLQMEHLSKVKSLSTNGVHGIWVKYFSS